MKEQITIRELSGKCKTDFDKWYNSNPSLYVHAFHLIPFQMQWGVYLEFFDSHGLQICMEPILGGDWRVFVLKDKFQDNWIDHRFSTLAEAQKAALEKANEIYNTRI